jgi:hypothetical protein
MNAFWIRDFFLPQLKYLKEALMNRLIPTFDTIAEEGEQVSREAWDAAAGASWDGDILEPSVDWDPGVDHYLNLMATRQSIINLCAVAIRHLFEQQCLMLLRRDLLPRRDELNPALANMSEFKRQLNNRRIDLASLDSWSILDELRLVSNVVKHAEGDSAAELRILRPEMFVHPDDRDSPPSFGDHHIIDELFQPLAGTDLYVTESDLNAYFDAASAFWLALERKCI